MISWENRLELLQVHCQGEIGKVLVGGAPEIPGTTMLDKMTHINRVDSTAARNCDAVLMTPSGLASPFPTPGARRWIGCKVGFEAELARLQTA